MSGAGPHASLSDVTSVLSFQVSSFQTAAQMPPTWTKRAKPGKVPLTMHGVLALPLPSSAAGLSV